MKNERTSLQILKTFLKTFAQIVPKPQVSNEKSFSVLSRYRLRKKKQKVSRKFHLVLRSAILCLLQVVLVDGYETGWPAPWQKQSHFRLMADTGMVEFWRYWNSTDSPCRKEMNWGARGQTCYGLNCVLSEDILKSHPQCLPMWPCFGMRSLQMWLADLRSWTRGGPNPTRPVSS